MNGLIHAASSIGPRDECGYLPETGHISNGQRAQMVAGHGFLTAPEILALLFQLDIDTVIARLDAATAAEPPASGEASTVLKYDRRAAPRVEPHELTPDLRLTLPGASNVVLVDISETGALIETSNHRSLGATVDLFVCANGRRYVVRARTVRSTLFAITPESGVVYRTALRFEQRLSLTDLLRR